MSSISRLAIHHLYKCGGQSIVDRYKHNPTFAYCRVPGELVLNYGAEPLHREHYPISDIDKLDIDVIMGHGVHMDLPGEWCHVSVLRDPVSRVVSGYNFHRLEMRMMYGVHTSIDFDNWFINRERVLPTPFDWQYRHWGDTLEVACAGVDQMDHLFILGDSSGERVDQLMQACGMTPDLDWTHRHDTGVALQQVGMEYVHWDELASLSQSRVRDEAVVEQQFYNYVRGRATC